MCFALTMRASFAPKVHIVTSATSSFAFSLAAIIVNIRDNYFCYCACEAQSSDAAKPRRSVTVTTLSWNEKVMTSCVA